MAPHRRRLPHIYPNGTPLFLTWHLHGSMPASLLPPPGPLSSGQAFVWLDRQLDNPRSGPMYLRQCDIARIVVDSIRKGVDLGHYELGAYVVMANHVHLLIQPNIAPDRLMKSLKGATAREANQLLGRTGEPFCQKESYDQRVKAGSCKSPRIIHGLALFFSYVTIQNQASRKSRRGTHECVRHN
jgi:REP element-mobilizing transposase RayT